MTNWLIKLILTVVIVLLALKFVSPLPISSVVTQKNDLFTVSGTGKVSVIPDTAIIDLGITSSQPTVKAAQNEANTVITNISKAVRELGISEKDIKTSNYSVYPQYDYRTGVVNKITSFQVTANLIITVRELDKANQVIDQATSKGANTVGGINLTVAQDKQKELLQQARDEAVKEAKAKAESLARSAGISLGRIINVQESDTSQPMPLLMNAKMSDAVGQGGGAPTEIQPGSTDIVSSVTLYYETR